MRGDTDAEIEATKRLSAAEARRNALEMQRGAVEQMPVSSGDPLEDHLARFTDRTAQWMRKNPEWVTDPRKNAKVTGAHNFAISEGLTPDTDEYFEYVERKIGMKSGGNGGSNRGGSSQRSSSNIDPHDAATHVRDGGKSVYLTENERKIATDGTLTFSHGPNRGKPLGLQEYSRRKAAMIAEGRYNKLG